ncbi:MAG TPA: dual specificity protein phosphatase [Planctomycetaceae bacterium]|jgi:protein-tyrosine phosphatase|nr:dual specificity protein phosphatase [Planctomycetaceae bacterium]
MREVIPQTLWIGNAREARDVKAVLGFGISAVVDLASEEPPILYPRDVVYCRFPLVDGAGNPPAVVRAAIDTTTHLIRGQVPTLVTCGGGMSRSPAIAAAALARFECASPQQSLERVAASGPHDVSTAFWADVLAASES